MTIHQAFIERATLGELILTQFKELLKK